MRKIFDSEGNVVAEVLGVVETNPHCDERLAANGGGYSHPTTVVRWEDWTVSIADTSCGDFGTRISVNAHQSGSDKEVNAYWGSMVPEHLRYSEFTADDIRMLDDIRSLTGYSIPASDDFREEEDDDDV